MARLTPEEQETIIRYNNRSSEPAIVFTYHRALITKLKKLADQREDIKLLDEVKEHGKVVACTFEVPRGAVKINPPKTRKLSEEHKKALLEGRRQTKTRKKKTKKRT